jgi:starvation-inducible DNA-binding protein
MSEAANLVVPNHSDRDRIDIGIAEGDRRAIASGLARVLADTYTLYLQSHNFHWNVEGPMFSTLHVMFMEQYTELWNALDEIAERIRSLGLPVPATYSELSRRTAIAEVDGVPYALDMVAALLLGHEAIARTIRSVLVIADQGVDVSTVDLLTQRLNVHEKTAWMLRSLLK